MGKLLKMFRSLRCRLIGVRADVLVCSRRFSVRAEVFVDRWSIMALLAVWCRFASLSADWNRIGSVAVGVLGLVAVLDDMTGEIASC